MENYKTIEEIMETEGLKPLYPLRAEELQWRALTMFAKKTEIRGGVIISASVCKIKNNYGSWKGVFKKYLRWTFKDTKKIYYFQFDSNPFFPCYGMWECKEGDHMKTTRLVELEQIWDGVDSYNPSYDNIVQLVSNIEKGMAYIDTLSTYKKDYVPYRDNIEQKIYNF